MRTIENLTPQAFREKIGLDEKAVILDVRTPEETAHGKIEGAKELNFFDPSFREQLQKLDKDKNYYVYCRSGNRSGKACQIMADEGFTGDLINLSGGYTAWEGHH